MAGYSGKDFNLLFSKMSEGVAIHEIIYDNSGKPADYRILDVNPSFEELTGIPRDQAVGIKASKLYGTGAAPFLDIYAEVAESGKSATFETFFEPISKYFSISAVATNPGKFAIIFNDITERQKSIDHTKQLNQFLLALRNVNQLITHVRRDPQHLIDAVSETLIQTCNYSHVWIVLFNRNGQLSNVTSSSPSAYWGKLKQEFENQHIPACAAAAISQSKTVVITASSDYCRRCSLSRGNATKLTAPLIHDHKLRGIISIDLVPGAFVGEEELSLFDEMAGDVAFALSDIESEEARIKTEKALAESENRYKSLFENSNDAIYVHLPGVQGRFIDVNQKACQQLGYSRAELLTMSPKDIDNPEIAVKAMTSAGKLLKEGHGVLEMEHIAKDGHHIPVELSTSSITLDGTLLQLTIARDLTERKKAEKELKDLSKFPAENPNPILRISRGGTILYANEASTPILDYFNARVSKHISLEGIIALKESLAKKSPSIIELEYQDIIYQLNITPVEGTEYSNVYGQDITEARQNDDLIRQSEEKYRVLFNFGNDGAFIHQPDENFLPGTILDCNRALVKLLGYSKRELLGKKITDIIKIERNSDVTSFMDTLKGEGSIVSERVYITKEGREIPVEISSSLFTYAEKPTVMTTVRDLTKRNQAEQSLKRSEARLASAVEAAGLFLYEEKGDKRINRRMTFIDEPMRDFIGLPEFQDYRARDYWNERIHPADYETAMLPAINRFENEGQNIVSAEYRYLHEKHGTIWFRHIVTAIQRNEKGEVLHLVGAVINITEQKHLQEEQEYLRNKAEINSRLATVGEMAAGIAHEINNPLTGVIGFSEILMEQDVPPEIKEQLQIINDGSKRVKDIVKRMLTFARQVKPMKSRIDIHELIENTLEIRGYVLKTANIEVVRDYGTDVPWITVDPGQLQQVFLNLIVNAEYAMKENPSTKGILKIVTRTTADKITLTFTDNGRGMSQDTKEKLFQPFFTTKAPSEGTGLGLSVSRSIVLEHGGSIYAESKPGNGTSFVIELPFKAEPEVIESSAAEVSSAPSNHVKARVMVVDDEPTVRSLIDRVLTHEGHSVRQVEKPGDALELLRNSQFDIVLLDIRLPGMSGIELFETISQTYPDLKEKMIFITGDTADSKVWEYLTEHHSNWINKPFERNTFLNKFNEVLLKK